MKKIAGILIFVLMISELGKASISMAQAGPDWLLLEPMEERTISFSDSIPEGTEELYWKVEDQIPKKDDGAEVIQLLNEDGIVLTQPALRKVKNGRVSIIVGGICEGSARLSCYRLIDGVPETIKEYRIEVKSSQITAAFKKKSYAIKIGDTIKFQPVIENRTKDTKVTFHTSNVSIASVLSDGRVKGLKPGKVTITCRVQGANKASAVCTLTVEKEKKGWHTTKSGKKYYVYSSGQHAGGYQKIGDAYYYFNTESKYMEKNCWKYVRVKGTRYKLRFGSKGRQTQNVSGLLGRQSSYHLKVNTKTNTVIAYAKDGRNGYIIPVKAFRCSTGKSGTPTKKGTFTLKRVAPWHTLMGNVYGQYCTRITEGYLFHSVYYSVYGNNRTLFVNEYRKLGQNASHGCVRLTVGDAKWIYDHCVGSKVTVFSGKGQEPLQKPTVPPAVETGGGFGYDRTDPGIRP